jgi:hypothetical protein
MPATFLGGTSAKPRKSVIRHDRVATNSIARRTQAHEIAGKGETLPMHQDLRLFIAAHVFDILMTVIYGVKVLFISKADLKTKFVSSLLLFAVLTLGRYLRIQMASSDTAGLWSIAIAIAIGVRLVALKLIFGVIDAEA